MIQIEDFFEVQKILWVGDDVITYLAVHENLNTKVIIKEFFPTRYVCRKEKFKVVPKPGMEEQYAAGLQRFRQEAYILNHLGKYGYIPQLLQLLERNNTYYIVLDYKEGITLAEYMKDDTKPKQNVKKVFHSLFDTLMFLHGNGVVHLDISPENLIIENQELFLIDFGSAEYISTLNEKKCGEVISGYEAPELRGTGMPVGTWTDIYEMCMVIYRYMGFELPENWGQLLDRRKRKCYLMHSMEGSEEGVRRGIAKGLAYRPQNRIQITQLYAGFYRQSNFHPILLILGGVALAGAFMITPPLKELFPVERREMYESFAKNIPEYTDESLLKYELHGEDISIVGCDISLTEVYIPTEIYGRKVTKIQGIGPNVVILFMSEGISSIGSGAFRNCEFLEEVYIPQSVHEIGIDAFANCNMLQSIFVHEGRNNWYYIEQGSLIQRKDGEVIWKSYENQ